MTTKEQQRKNNEKPQGKKFKEKQMNKLVPHCFVSFLFNCVCVCVACTACHFRSRAFSFDAHFCIIVQCMGFVTVLLAYSLLFAAFVCFPRHSTAVCKLQWFPCSLLVITFHEYVWFSTVSHRLHRFPLSLLVDSGTPS